MGELFKQTTRLDTGISCLKVIEVEQWKVVMIKLDILVKIKFRVTQK